MTEDAGYLLRCQQFTTRFPAVGGQLGYQFLAEHDPAAELPGGTLGFDVREIEDRQFLVTPRMFILRNVLVCLFFCYHDLSYQG